MTENAHRKPEHVPESGASAGGDAMRALSASVAVATRLLLGALVVLLLVSLLRSYVVVKQHQTGLVYRFGKPVRTLGPGEHALVFPPPVDEVRMYSVTREQVLETEELFYALTDVERRTGAAGPVPEALRPGIDGYVVTADRHIVHCRAQLFYRVSDPVAFYEMHADGDGVLRALLHHACVRASSRRTIEDVLFELPAFSERVSFHLTESATALGLGVTVNRLVLKVVPPRQVKEAFDAQIAAGQEADQARKEAESYRVSVLNDAAVLADRAVSDAEAQRRTQVQQAEARADTFRTLLAQYRAIGDAMMQDLHTSTLKRVLETVDETFLVSEEGGRQVRLQVGRRTDRAMREKNDQEPGTRD